MTFFLGYARSKIDIKEFLTKTSYEYMKVRPGEEKKFAEFVELNSYLSGSYDKAESFKELDAAILDLSTKLSKKSRATDEVVQCNRIFYLALPPSVYTSVTKLLSDNCKAKKYIKLGFLFSFIFISKNDSNNQLNFEHFVWFTKKSAKKNITTYIPNKFSHFKSYFTH